MSLTPRSSRQQGQSSKPVHLRIKCFLSAQLIQSFSLGCAFKVDSWTSDCKESILTPLQCSHNGKTSHFYSNISASKIISLSHFVPFSSCTIEHSVQIRQFLLCLRQRAQKAVGHKGWLGVWPGLTCFPSLGSDLMKLLRALIFALVFGLGMQIITSANGESLLGDGERKGLCPASRQADPVWHCWFVSPHLTWC